MPNKNDRLMQNAPGRFYVDNSCVDCDMCRESAAAFFHRNDEAGLSVVYRQPQTPEEIALAHAALEECPSSSIGNDGDPTED